MRIRSILLFLSIGSPVLAHSGGEHVHGFLAGLSHPFLGLDHLLVMVAVGIWSGLFMKTKKWLPPALFMTGMLTGVALVALNLHIPYVEGGILLSTILMATALIFSKRDTNSAIIGIKLSLFAIFGVFHGAAHQLEATGAFSSYILGFIFATSLAHALGYATTFIIHNKYAPQVTGGFVALSAFALALS